MVAIANGKPVAEAGRLGAVEKYALARVTPAPGELVTCSQLFSDYRSWCVREGLAPLREAVFTEAFEVLAREAEIPIRQRGSNLSFVDVALADAPLC